MRVAPLGTMSIAVLLLSSIALLSLAPNSCAEIFYLHAESSTGTFLDLRIAGPEPNSTTVSADVPSAGLFKVGEGWIQADKYDYERDMSGIWNFTMYGYCDDDVVAGRLFAKVFDSTNTRLNSGANRSGPIGPCSNPTSPKKISWNDVLDRPQAQAFAAGERFRVEIWLDASSGGSTGTIQTASDELLTWGELIDGSYVDTQKGNEGPPQYEHLREKVIPCGATTIFPVVNESRTEGTAVGDFTKLAANDEDFEQIQEEGAQNSLEWNWTINITHGTGQYAFFLDATIGTAPGNDDNFRVEYSTTGAFAGEEQLMFEIDGTWTGNFNDPPFAYYHFPDGALSGADSVYVRVVDTNELDSDPASRDVLKVDRMYIEFTDGAKNCSALEHVWLIQNIPLATEYEIFVNGYRSNSIDGDEFRFSYTFGNRFGRYEEIFVLNNTTDEDYYLASTIIIPSGYTAIWVKVEDTNRIADLAAPLDDLFLDHIYLLTKGGGVPYQFHLIVDNESYPSAVETVERVIGEDEVRPVSSVLPLDRYQTERTFEVHWVATDTGGSGVFGVHLWYIDPSGREHQVPGIFETSPINFTASRDGVYQFYTTAIDRAGNEELPPHNPDARTTVDTIPPEIREVEPYNSQTRVSRTTQIVIRFRESMDSESVNDAFELVEANGGRKWRAIDGEVEWNHPINDTFKFKLPKGHSLEYGKQYYIIVDVGAKDRAGNNLSQRFQSSFRTATVLDAWLIIIIMAVAITIMVVILILYLIGRKTEKEKEVPSSAPPPLTAVVSPGLEVAPEIPESGTRQIWEARKPSSELWKEGAKEYTCQTCGRFLPEGALHCPYCGRDS